MGHFIHESAINFIIFVNFCNKKYQNLSYENFLAANAINTLSQKIQKWLVIIDT